MDADRREAATLNVDPVAMMANGEKLKEAARQKAVTELAVQVSVKTAGHLDLRCKVDDLRSRNADLVLVDLRGHRVDIAADHRSAVVRHSVEVLPEWDHPGCNAASHSGVDHRSATVGRDVLRWDHRG